MKIGTNFFNIENELLNDLFEVKKDVKIIKVGSKFIVYQSNSDGAGGYDLVWIFNKDGLVKREVGSLI